MSSLVWDPVPTYGADLGVAGRVGLGLLFLLLLLHCRRLLLHFSHGHFALLLLLICGTNTRGESIRVVSRRQRIRAPGSPGATRRGRVRRGAPVPAGDVPLLGTLCERMMAIQPSTSTVASFRSSEIQIKTGLKLGL